ncbi:hypothetical protein PEC301937_09600 [Pectobacterium carotovorum subsp. carotovorum]|nr:hypothetical protein PEC301937_09600 [Pectobacterium carotovorum subsp. carotovorum]
MIPLNRIDSRATSLCLFTGIQVNVHNYKPSCLDENTTTG